MVSQAKAQSLTDSLQPLDVTRDHRCYIVMSTSASIKRGGQRVVCYAIQSTGNGTEICIEIPGGISQPSGLHKEKSYCNFGNPYTLPRACFLKKIGHVHSIQQKEINKAILDFFQLAILAV